MKKSFWCALFLCLAVFCFPQTLRDDAADGSASAAEMNESDIGVAETDENSLFLSAENAYAETEARQPSTLYLLVRMILVLICVVAAVYGIFYFFRRMTNTAVPQNPYLKNPVSLALGQGKSVHVVTLGDRAYLVGAADSSVGLIAEIADKELIDAMNLHADAQPAGKPKDFASLLAAFFPEKKTGGESARIFAKTTAEATADELRKQQNRLQQMRSENLQ
ncbi:MAG: flagellar biosynthetic protein FliO [Bacteroides sp.]|nr:flagellar biosynthetic protein FliO [Prevotella sp.]MCM1407335.1 flagellar biosynthetic protein FliO [Treponema brennaborense]MCM1469825.1 flagellar biosynthetic protein FliO [Bacteroides sp.]